MRRTRKFVVIVSALWIAIVTAAHLLGEPAKPVDPGKKFVENAPRDKDLLSELDATKFLERPLITYKAKDGTTFFALQLKPALAPADARPRDYVILLSTAASMAQGELALATKVIEDLTKDN